MLKLPLLSLAAALSAAPLTPAADWPEFRGSATNGSTTEEDLPLEWSQSKNVLWKMAPPGSGWSSPVVADGILYITTAIESGGGLSLHALAYWADDGTPVWDREVFEVKPSEVARIHKKNGQASPTPIVRGGALYVHFGHMGTAKLDAGSGSILWANDDLKYTPVHGNGGSPILVGNSLIFTADGGDNPTVNALDAQTGKPKWQHRRDVEAKKTFSFCTPLAIEVDGRTQVIAPGSNVVSALDPESGSEIWRVGYNGYSVVPQPLFAHGLVFLSTGYDSPVVMAIRPDGTGDVTGTHVAWSTGKRGPNTPSFAIVGDELYMAADGGIVSCLDAKTGEVHWYERATGPISASPVVAPGRLYLTDEQGKTTVLATGKTFKVLAENEIGERTLASMAVGEGVLFLRTEEHLFALGEER